MLIAGSAALAAWARGSRRDLTRDVAHAAAHEKAYRTGLKLKQLKQQVEKEYAQRGQGLSMDEFLSQSRSFLVSMYNDAAESMMLKMTTLQQVTADCVATDKQMKEEIKELQAEFVDAAMHCRRLTAAEFETLDIRVAMELDGADHTAVVVPFRSAEELSVSRFTRHFEADGRLESYVNNGCCAFVGISCDVHPIQLAGSLTLNHNPCLPPRLGPGTMRLGRCLRVLFLADNNLGAYDLRSILKGMQHSRELEVFHCHANGIGELGEGPAAQNPDQDPTDALSALDELGEIVRANKCPLRVLGLSKNRIGAAGLSNLMPGIAMNETIVILDLSDNSLGISGANHIAKCLVTNRTIQTLNVNNSMLTQYGLRAICSALAFNSTLRILYALKNVGPAARQDVFKKLEENTTIEVMHLFADTPWMNPNYLGAASAVQMERFNEVPGGIPFVIRVSLLREFETFDAIGQASEDAIQKVPGMKMTIASAISAHFRSCEPSGSSENPSTVQLTSGAMELLESKGYYQEVDDPWNVSACLQESEIVWEPVTTESYRLEFSRRRPVTRGTETTIGIPSPDRFTPDRVSTPDTRLTTPDHGSRPVSREATSVRSDAFKRTVSGASSRASGGKTSGASQVEERLRAAEQKRKATSGINVFWANAAMVPVDLSAKPLPQPFGPERKVGVNKITSAQILGLGVKGAVVKKHLQCRFCMQLAEDSGKGATSVAQAGRGHEEYECPVNFFKTYGELLPGWTQYGAKDEDLWEPGNAETKPEVYAMWSKLEARGYFAEPAEGIPVLERKIKLADIANNGVARKFWDERGAFTSKDAALRKEMFETTSRTGEAMFTHGSEQFTAFLKERSFSGLSDPEKPSRPGTLNSEASIVLPGIDDLSIEARSRLHVGNHDWTHRSDVQMAEHDGVKFIPSGKKRKELFLQKIRNNHVDDVKQFIEGNYGAVDVNCKDTKTGASALIEACMEGNKRIAKLLIKHKADVNTQDKKGNTALHYAVSAEKFVLHATFPLVAHVLHRCLLCNTPACTSTHTHSRSAG